MVGSQLVYANGVSSGTITAFGSTTSLTVATSQTVASQAYNINYSGLNVTSTGLVGIGTTTPATKLDVAGGIRPGSTGVTTGGACTPEGTFAYDSNAHAPVFCNNFAVWQKVGGAANPPTIAFMAVTPGSTCLGTGNYYTVTKGAGATNVTSIIMKNHSGATMACFQFIANNSLWFCGTGSNFAMDSATVIQDGVTYTW